MHDKKLLKMALMSMGPISEEVMDDFLAKWQELQVPRKTCLTSGAEVERYLYFVREGVQRILYQDDQGREATIVFSFSPSFSGVIDSFFLQKPSNFYFETLTASSFFRISYAQLSQATAHSPELFKAIHLGLCQAFSGVLLRMVELQCYSSEEKFKILLQRSPNILQMVPQKYLANYLGIDATNFSKLMHSVKI